MIEQAKVQETTLTKLEEYTGCTCVPSNTTKDLPAYDYISFSVIRTDTRKGTYAQATVNKNGVEIPVLYMPASQTWSFTVHSDDDARALEKAMLVKDFFEEVKRQELADNDIIVADVGGITPRDTLLTIEYEYRKGLDVTLRLNNVIEKPDNGIIETATLASNAGVIELEKE